jgi:NAD kinase
MNPFALTVRPIVFPEHASLSVDLLLGDGTVTADGFLNRNLRQGDCVQVSPYRRALRVIRFGEADRFFERLRVKIGWGTPLVPLR